MDSRTGDDRPRGYDGSEMTDEKGDKKNLQEAKDRLERLIILGAVLVIAVLLFSIWCAASPFWKGLMGGLFIGVFVGITAMGLAVSASRKPENWHEEME